MENNKSVLPILPSGEELEAKAQSAFLPEDEWEGVDIEGNVLELDDDLETPEYTLEMNGVPIAPVTGVQVIAGQSGHGKTQTMTLLMATYLGANTEGFTNIWNKKAKVLYVDTEMEKGNTQLVVLRVARICNCDPSALKDQLNVVRLREEESHEIIWRKILKSVSVFKPDVLFLDGMIDVIGDINDNKEAKTIIRKVMKTADHYNMAIWTVMHQNPGSLKLAGHEGSFLERKCTLILPSIKICDDEELGLYHFEIKCLKSRGQDVKPLPFYMAKFALPNGKTNAFPVVGTRNGSDTSQEEDNTRENMKRLFNVIFDEAHEQYTTGDFEDRIRTAVKQLGLQNGKGSSYTVAGVEGVFKSEGWVNIINGNRGSKLWQKAVPFL